MATGTTTVDFGAWPGSTEASVTITGQTGILSGSLVEAWILPDTTADHTIGDHIAAPIKVVAHTISAGVGFTITATLQDQQQEPVMAERGGQTHFQTGTSITTKQARPGNPNDIGGWSPMVHGVFNIAWAWA